MGRRAGRAKPGACVQALSASMGGSESLTRLLGAGEGAALPLEAASNQ